MPAAGVMEHVKYRSHVWQVCMLSCDQAIKWKKKADMERERETVTFQGKIFYKG